MNALYGFVIRQNWWDIIPSISMLIMTMIFHYFVRNLVYRRAENTGINQKGPLPDLIHTYLQVPEQNGKHTDYVIRYMVSGFIIVCFIFDRIDICLHCLKLYCLLKLFRTLCMSVTILPDISGKGKNTWLGGGTNDLMFSGHVMLSSLLERYYVNYFFRDELFWFPMLFNLAIAANTVMTKRHYTIDVIFAWYITYTFYELSNRYIDFPPKIQFVIEENKLHPLSEE